VAAFVNVPAVVDYLGKLNEDFVIVCAGKEHGFCIEDVVCGGMIVHLLEKNDVSTQCTDGAVAARALYKSFGRSINKMLRNSDHGQYLISIGFESDLKICAAVDSVPVLPILDKGVIKLKKSDVGPQRHATTGSQE
jgi:2-phosphosulfolactate phosphatase